jgi:hypothetical protein
MVLGNNCFNLCFIDKWTVILDEKQYLIYHGGVY